MKREITELIELVFEDSSWIKDEKWYEKDGSLREVIEAEKLGLFEPPKIFFHLKKNFFERIFKERNKWGIVIIRGPRRIGKTSTLKYLVKEMIEKGYPKESFFYISLDNEKLLEILEKRRMLRGFLKELIKKFEDKKPLIIILDEVTFYKGWARALKNLVDSGDVSEGIGIIATGSYSIELSSARSELSGRYGPLGERLGGEIFFYPRRFIEVSENLLGKEFRKFFSRTFGKIGKRFGILEFLAGYQENAENVHYEYERKINEMIEKYLDDLRGVLEIYKFSGGYPRAFFEAIITSQEKGEMKTSDARYKDDIFELFVTDCRKFKLDEEILKRILVNITFPSMQISRNFDTILSGIEFVKKNEISRYIKYFKASGLIDFIPSISSPKEINISAKSVLPSSKNLKLIVTDPAAFISFYLCSRGVTKNIFSRARKLISGKVENALMESIVISHLRYLPFNPSFSNTGYILERADKEEEELADAFVWYVNHRNELVTMAIEVKNTEKIDKEDIEETSEKLKDYNVKRMIVVSKSKKFEVTEDYVNLPIEIFLLLC